MLKLVDVHAHLSDNLLFDNIDELRREYLEKGVSFVIDSGCSLKNVEKCVINSQKYSEIYFTAGLHPENANNAGEINAIMEYAKHPKCVAIGEIGLDYHYEGYNKELQKEAFITQLEVANTLNLPVVIHSRDACYDTVTLLKEHKNLLKNGFLMHCFSESLETGKELLKLGAHFSFGGALTFKNSNRIEVFKNLPLEVLHLETDSPYLTPTPYRGTLNSPKYIDLTYNFVAEKLGVEKEYLASVLYNNALNFFKKIKI
ncbi:MAG: TatD family hydrolase [Clostridia bacterium]|nr:TatD family hydrolase [Clostridia bacterium]